MGSEKYTEAVTIFISQGHIAGWAIPLNAPSQHPHYNEFCNTVNQNTAEPWGTYQHHVTKV